MPNQQRRVILVPSDHVTDLFSEVAAQLRAHGIAVTEYESALACTTDGERSRNADALLAMHDFPLSYSFMKTMPSLRAALSFITGTDGFDEKAATKLGIVISNGQVAESVCSMAEATIMLMLAAFYDLRGSEQALRQNHARSSVCRASMLMGKTIGIVGFGKIAQAVTERLRGWGVDIQVYARDKCAPLPSGVTGVQLEDLLRTSDAILLLASLNSESRHMLNRERLRLIRPGTVLVNTARGALIDQAELCAIAAAGRFRALALDTYEQEPLPTDSSLRDLPSAILTGHNVGYTAETRQALVRTAVDNLRRVARGELPSNIRNAEVIPAWEKRWSRERID